MFVSGGKGWARVEKMGWSWSWWVCILTESCWATKSWKDEGTLMRYFFTFSQLWAVKNVSFYFSLHFFPAVLQPAVVGMLLELCAICYVRLEDFWEMSTWYIVSFYLAVYILFTSRYYLFEKCTTKAVRSEDPIPVTLTAFREIRQLQWRDGRAMDRWRVVVTEVGPKQEVIFPLKTRVGERVTWLGLEKHLIAIGDFF